MLPGSTKSISHMWLLTFIRHLNWFAVLQLSVPQSIAFRGTEAKRNNNKSFRFTRWKATKYQLKINFCIHQNKNKTKKKGENITSHIISSEDCFCREAVQMLQSAQVFNCFNCYIAVKSTKLQKSSLNATSQKNNCCNWHLALHRGIKRTYRAKGMTPQKMVTHYHPSLQNCDKHCTSAHSTIFSILSPRPNSWNRQDMRCKLLSVTPSITPKAS